MSSCNVHWLLTTPPNSRHSMGWSQCGAVEGIAQPGGPSPSLRESTTAEDGGQTCYITGKKTDHSHAQAVPAQPPGQRLEADDSHHCHLPQSPGRWAGWEALGHGAVWGAVHWGPCEPAPSSYRYGEVFMELRKESSFHCGFIV